MKTKKLPTEKQLARETEQILRARLPSDWSIETSRETRVDDARPDLLIELETPTGERTVLVVEIKRTLEPRRIDKLADQLTAMAERLPNARPIVASAYLSPRSREMLLASGVDYVDATGNVRLSTSSPAIFIETMGASHDPWPADDELQSLRGRGSARAVRAIVDNAPPFGVRELASKTSTSVATISRVLELLERDALITREPRGPVESVDWKGVIRRWAGDYEQYGTNRPATFLEPRGMEALNRKLASAEFSYAATGAFAAQQFETTAPARTAAIYTDDIFGFAEGLDLREVDTGSNVVLLEPFDPVVFDRTIIRDRLRCVASTQLAVDLLTGPGREPSQGEELLTWMERNQDVWQS